MKRNTMTTLILSALIVANLNMPISASAEETAKEPATAAAPKAAEAPAESASGINITQLVVGTGVENKAPVGASDKFPATTEAVFCFLEATDVKQDTEVVFAWYKGDKEVAKVTLPLKAGKKWRTFSSKKLGGATGNWKVDVQDAQGKVIKSVVFNVE